MRKRKILTLAVVAVMALSVVGPAAAADGLDVSISQDEDDVTVSVTSNNSSVADADVVVEAENASYDDAGNYTTDDEGVVELSAPGENLTVSVSATSGNLSGSATADLLGEAAFENETEENETGENETEDNGTGFPMLDLDLSFDNGTVDYSNVTVNDSTPFGHYVGSFVHTVMDKNTTGPFGQTVSSFVTTFNPGQGPPENNTQGPPENVTQGPPENVTQGPPENKTRGPPENKTRGPPENKTRGPPEDAGPPEKNKSLSSDPVTTLDTVYLAAKL